MAQDIETFFMLKDELFLSVEYAHTNTSEANQIADKLLLLTGEVEPRIGEINERTLNLSARNNFSDLGKKSLDDLNNHLGEIGFKKDRILAAINLISDTLQQLKNKEYEKWAQNISALANQVIYNAAETSRDVGRLREEAKESLDKLDNLRRDLKETREDMNEADDLVSRLPSLAKMAKDSMLRNEAEMKAAQDEKSNLDVKFARLDDKLREIRSAINMGMWAMKFDQTQKSYAKLRTPKIVETDYLQHDIRLVISGADSVAEPNGLLYFIGNPTASTNLKSDYMGLRLKEGKLEFFWSTSPGQRHIITTDVEFKPSESYTIRATRSGFETTLKVYLVSVKISSEQSDGTLLASASFSELEQYPKLVMRLSDKTRYFFGGVPTTETTFASLIGDVEHFKGCIHLFVLNNVVMNLWNYELASQVSACYPEKKQSPYYRNDDFGFACSWESNAYVKRNLPLSESFAVSGRVSSQERVQLTKIEMLEQSKNGSLIAYAVLRDKYSAAEIGKDFLRVVCRDNYTCEVQAADASVSNVYNVVDKRNNKKPLSQMKLDFMTNNDNIIFSSEINKIRRSNKIEDKSFTVKALQSFDLDLFIVGVNGEVKLLQKLKNGNAFENLESMMGCFRLRDLFASPTTHSEWLDYEKWVHAGLYLYPLATPVYTTMQLDGNDESLFAVVNPPAVGNRIAFQIKTEADSALLMFLMAPDEKSGVSVSLVNGKVSVRERRSKSPDDIYSISSEEPINDKQWHSVAVMKHLASRQWIVMVDDDREKTTIVQLKDLNTIEEISGQVMNVGGIPDTQTLDQYKNLLPSSKGFNGCIRDLIFEQTIEGNSAAVQIGDESEFKPAFKWNKLSPGIGSKGYKIGCEI